MKVNDALNKPKTKFGLDYRILVGALFVSLLVFLFVSKLIAFLLFGGAIVFGKTFTHKDPKRLEIMWRWRKKGTLHDPGVFVD